MSPSHDQFDETLNIRRQPCKNIKPRGELPIVINEQNKAPFFSEQKLQRELLRHSPLTGRESPLSTVERKAARAVGGHRAAMAAAIGALRHSRRAPLRAGRRNERRSRGAPLTCRSHRLAAEGLGVGTQRSASSSSAVA